jgi:hypothetical protein
MRGYSHLPSTLDPATVNYLLDGKLQKLLRPDSDKAAQVILAVIVVIYSEKYRLNQEWLVSTLKSTEDLLNILEANPSLERNSDILEGCLTRPLLHFRRADICFALRDFKRPQKKCSSH